MYTNKFIGTAQPLTEADIAEAERTMGQPLPPDLRRHFLLYNGGVPERRYFVTTRGIQLGVSMFLTMCYGDPRSPTLEQIFTSLVHEKQLMPPHLLPFAENAGGDFFCLDRRDQGVVYYTMDDCFEPATAAKRIADSLTEFVNGMVTEAQACRR